MRIFALCFSYANPTKLEFLDFIFESREFNNCGEHYCCCHCGGYGGCGGGTVWGGVLRLQR